jgi:hypothetical protein
MANNNIIQLAAARPRRSPPGSAAFEPTRRAIEARLNGAARHVTVPPTSDLTICQALVLFAVAAFIGAMLAIGGVL